MTSGAWEQATPIGTVFNGQIAAPDQDATQGQDNTMAMVTQNGLAGGSAGVSDIDGGPVRLISPRIDAAGTDAIVSYARWFYWASGTPDQFLVDVSNDGGQTWVPVPEHTTGGTGSAWETVSFVLGDYIEPTADMRVRFTASDNPNDSVTEAGLDNFQVDIFDCGPELCAGDTDGNGTVDVDDLTAVILDWGTDGSANNGDVNGSGVVDVDDLTEIILGWGPCP